MDYIRAIERQQIREDIPQVRVGDNVKIYYRIVEGDRTREQVFQGDVIRMSSEEMRATVLSAREFRSWRIAREDDSACGEVCRARLEPKAKGFFESYAARFRLGGRAIVRISRVARTVADVHVALPRGTSHTRDDPTTVVPRTKPGSGWSSRG